MKRPKPVGGAHTVLGPHTSRILAIQNENEPAFQEVMGPTSKNAEGNSEVTALPCCQ